MKMKENENFGLKLDIQKTKILISGPITGQQMNGKKNGNTDTLFWTAPKLLQIVTAPMKLKDTALG